MNTLKGCVAQLQSLYFDLVTEAVDRDPLVHVALSRANRLRNPCGISPNSDPPEVAEGAGFTLRSGASAKSEDQMS